MLSAFGADVKFSALPTATSPSTNSYVPIIDLNLLPAAQNQKYLITNFALVSQIPSIPTGLVSNNVAQSGLLAVGPDKTNGITATSAMVTNALGYVPVNKAGDSMPSLQVAQLGFTNYTAAALPVGVDIGYQAYCSNCLTPTGVGDMVSWDGFAWKSVKYGVCATTNVTAYILSCVTNALAIDTQLSQIAITDYTIESMLYQAPRTVTPSTGSIAVAADGSEAIGIYTGYSTSTSSSAAPRMNGAFVPPPVAGGFYGTGTSLYLTTAIPDGTDNYWIFTGWHNSSAAGFPSEGAAFLYDRYNAAGRASPGAETNHWLCVTTHGSSSTYTDSGLTPSSTTSAPDRLAVIVTTAAVYFYTNGVACATNVTNIPTGFLTAEKTTITKTLGSNARGMREVRPWMHIRRANARTF